MSDNLAAALAAVQANLPHIGKDNLAVVKSDKGQYKYTYADLADISAKVLPVLAKNGLSFSAKPTLNDDGKFVLAYTLRHTSGESDSGQYPLSGSTPQQVGSAITYARRYSLCAMVGVVPDEDDDGAAASEPPAVQARPVQNGASQAKRELYEHDQSELPPPVLDAAGKAKAALRKSCAENGWDLTVVADLFAGEHQAELRETTNADLIEKFRQSLYSIPSEQLQAAS